jgi:general secretion pathway protein K
MSDSRRRGFALIAVLWFLVLIAAIGTYLMANARTETAIARNIRSSARAEALADAGIAQTVFNLDDVISSNRWKLDGSPHRLKLSGGEVTIRVSDETAKINPNLASPALMAALFEATGIDRAHARPLSEAVADWVAPARPPSPGSPADDRYQRAGLSYRAPHAPVETLDELQLVIGMTPERFALVRPYLTIYTQEAEPDAKNASPVIRRALLLAAKSPPEDAGSQPDSDPVDTDPAAESAGPAAQGNPTPAPQAGNASESVVEVTVTARSDDGGIFVRHAVLRLEEDGPKGYATLEWRRGDLVND